MGWRALGLHLSLPALSPQRERGRPRRHSYGTIPFLTWGLCVSLILATWKCILSGYSAFMWVNFSLRIENAFFFFISPLYLQTQHPSLFPVSLSVTSFITVCFVIIFLYSKPHFLLVEIDSSNDTKQFISPFIPCFLLIDPPPPWLSVSHKAQWEEEVRRLIGHSANCPALCLSCDDRSDCGLLGLQRLMQWYVREITNHYSAIRNHC